MELAPEPRGAETLFRQATAPFALQPATKAIADCYLVGFAEAAGAQVVTFDRSLAATARFRQVPVALLEPAEKADVGCACGDAEAPRTAIGITPFWAVPEKRA